MNPFESVFRLRQNIFHFQKESIAEATGIVLEIGPAIPATVPIPQFFLNTREHLPPQVTKYLTCERDGDADYVCDFLDIERHLKGDQFDTVLAFEVFEHTSRIWEVPGILHRILRPNGKFFVSTPFLFQWHGPFPDYWRITPDGYRELFADLFNIEIKPYTLEDEYHILNIGVKGVKK